MTVSILVITHNGIGQAMINTAASMLGSNPVNTDYLSIPANLKPEDLGFYADQIRESINRNHSEDGVLILTDICGATPNNLARYFGERDDIHIISGLNLPMLLRVLNYASKPLSELTTIAIDGGQKGIQQDL